MCPIRGILANDDDTARLQREWIAAGLYRWGQAPLNPWSSPVNWFSVPVSGLWLIFPAFMKASSEAES
jgi:hypothetical protein